MLFNHEPNKVWVVELEKKKLLKLISYCSLMHMTLVTHVKCKNGGVLFWLGKWESTQARNCVNCSRLEQFSQNKKRE